MDTTWPSINYKILYDKRGSIIKFHTGILSQQNEWNTHKIIDTTKKIFMRRLSVKQKQ